MGVGVGNTNGTMTDMTNTVELEIAPKQTSCGLIYHAEFAECTIEVAEDGKSLSVIDCEGESERWVYDENGGWLFESSDSQGYCPTESWTDEHHNVLEAALDKLQNHIWEREFGGR